LTVSVKREALALVVLILTVDAVFVGAYFLAGLPRAASGPRLGFTIAWTLVTLAVAVRGLTRIRRARIERA
jgi:hypothetical protein